MGKTIDVEGGPPQGWPPQDGDSGGGKGPRKFTGFGAGGQKPPIIVTIAAAVFGIILVVGLLMAPLGRLLPASQTLRVANDGAD